MHLFNVMDNHDNSYTGITVRADDADEAINVFIASPYYNQDVEFVYDDPRQAYTAEKVNIIDAVNNSLVG
jgi:hypothetical protein